MNVFQLEKPESAPNLQETNEATDSPRKRVRLEKLICKSWSLTDRNSEQELAPVMGVGIEGVGLLDPDDGEKYCDVNIASSSHKNNLKRKYDIENVNPNINSCTKSPRSKYSPQGSPRAKLLCNPCSPCSSRLRSPKSSEKHKLLQPTEQSLDTTILNPYQIDEETPLAQTVGHGRGLDSGLKYAMVEKKQTPVKKPAQLSLGAEEEILLSRLHKYEPQGVDSFSVFSDEVMLIVFRWLPKRTLAHCMLVSKRWQRVASDESLWQRLDLGNKNLSKGAIGRILARKPVIVRLASSEISEWHPQSITIPSKIQYLDLSMCTIDQITLDSLLAHCPKLKKLSLENVQIYDSTCEQLAKCMNLEALNLTVTRGLTAEGLATILDKCTCLQALNVSWCSLTENAVRVLVTSLPLRLQRLNLAGAKIMSDDMVEKLVARCSRLLELDLSDCPHLGEGTINAVLHLNRLEHLALSRCYSLHPLTLTKLGRMPSMQFLDIWGMLQSSSLENLKYALPSIQINQFMFSAIARPTVGTRRTSIWGLRTRD